ncbi:hypothetical protein FACS189427_12370 [Planctomycetales bacterium]|nr:hypothetical protein FACS189427_12370 [Planctomycetales bacterium]
MKFGIDFPLEEASEAESSQLKEKIRQLTHEKYHEKEIQFPVLAGLMHFTVNDVHGKRYDREGLVEWAKERFAVILSLEDLKSKQRHEIEQTMFEQSKIASEHVNKVYAELREKLDDLFRESGIEPDELRKRIADESIQSGAGKVSAGSKFAARSIARQKSNYAGKYSSGKGSADNVPLRQTIKIGAKLQEFCDWANTEFASSVLSGGLTPEKVRSWDITEVEDRLCSIAEDRFNPEMRQMERSLVLQILDTIWKDHLLAMDHLRSGIGLMGYAQIDPKVAFKKEGMKIFAEMWESVYSRVTDLIFRMEQLDPGFVASTWKETETRKDEIAANATLNDFQRQQTETADNSGTEKKLEPIRNRGPVYHGPAVGKNELCPCGSGKKYKRCCGKKQE